MIMMTTSSTTSSTFSCRLKCPSPASFSYSPAPIYTCKYSDGFFLPSQVIVKLAMMMTDMKIIPQVPVCQYGPGAQLIRQEASDDTYALESECGNLFDRIRILVIKKTWISFHTSCDTSLSTTLLNLTKKMMVTSAYNHHKVFIKDHH